MIGMLKLIYLPILLLVSSMVNMVISKYFILRGHILFSLSSNSSREAVVMTMSVVNIRVKARVVANVMVNNINIISGSRGR